MKKKLDPYEKEIEDNALEFRSVREDKRMQIDGLIDQANAKKSISLRLRNNDLELLKRRADQEGLPYQTLLSSIVHKFVSDQLIEEKSVMKSMELLRAS